MDAKDKKELEEQVRVLSTLLAMVVSELDPKTKHKLWERQGGVAHGPASSHILAAFGAATTR